MNPTENPALRANAGRRANCNTKRTASACKVLLLLGAVWARNGGLTHNTNRQLIVTYERFGPIALPVGRVDPRRAPIRPRRDQEQLRKQGS